jgi:hypothetical protein
MSCWRFPGSRGKDRCREGALHRLRLKRPLSIRSCAISAMLSVLWSRSLTRTVKKSLLLLLAIFVTSALGCHRNQPAAPGPQAQSKSPEQVLLDRTFRSLNKQRYMEAGTLLATLITTYPESQCLERTRAAIEQCSRNPECDASLNCRFDGCMTFFAPPGSVDAEKKDKKEQPAPAPTPVPQIVCDGSGAKD